MRSNSGVRNRRSREPTVTLDPNVPEIASHSEASGVLLTETVEEPDQEDELPVLDEVANNEGPKRFSKEASIPTRSPNAHRTQPTRQETCAPEANSNRPITAQRAKALGKEHPANDDGVVEDMKIKFTASKNAPLWNKYVRISEAQDKDILEDWEGAIDGTLVFAALFSAISTSFVLESSKNLKPDQGAVTVLAIRELTSVVQAGSQLPTGNALSPREQAALRGSFEPSAIDVWINCLWFLSLGLSISVSLFAMLAKRWCYRSRSTHSGTDYERAMRRQKAWDTLQKWKLELFIEQLPTVMHVALMSFFVGLLLYLSQFHLTTMVITAIPVGFTIVSYGALTVLPAWSPSFPMVTPFTRIMQAGTWYSHQLGLKIWSKYRAHPLLSGMKEVVDSAARVASWLIKVVQRLVVAFCPSRCQDNQTETSPHELSVLSERWHISGATLDVGKRVAYMRSEEQRYPFRALLWLLRNSNDKSIINEVLEYVGSFPEVILDSFANSQELLEATTAVTEHFQRLKHDPIEWHDLNATQFSAKCGRFLYLTARPWLHYSVSESRRRGGDIMKIYDFMFSHNPDMSKEEVNTELKAIQDKKFPDAGCILWLERQAVKIVLGCRSENGFKMCRTLFMSIVSKVPVDHEQAQEIYSTLSWMFLNTVTDARSGDYITIWPTRQSWTDANGGADSSPRPAYDNTLTLSYFRHSEARKACSKWLQIVGLSGMLYVPTCLPYEDVQPDISSNEEYYAKIIELLRTKLTTSAAELLSGNKSPESDPYVGRFPIYLESTINLWEFDSLEYCYDALDRAVRHSRFANLLTELKELKDMIPKNRRHGPRRSGLNIRAAVASPNRFSSSWDGGGCPA